MIINKQQPKSTTLRPISDNSDAVKKPMAARYGIIEAASMAAA